ncbi:MAG: hypothetical protein KIS66_00415 [Fimbriimonadaceae bacterium]|nr:hypothetical protein [Fimbriimonadaceae bacterium]
MIVAVLGILIASLGQGAAPDPIFRFRPKEGRVYLFDLSVERERPRSVGTLRIRMGVPKVTADVVTTEFTVPSMHLDGQDR